MGKENENIQGKSESVKRATENMQFWDSRGISSFFEGMEKKASDKGDIVSEVTYGNENRSISLVFNWYNKKGDDNLMEFKWSSVMMIIRGEELIQFVTRKDGDKKEDKYFDLSKEGETDKMKKEVDSVFLKYLALPIED
jgi:hypothetical protein